MSRLPKVHDPERIILRRSIRVAIFLPISFAVMAYVLQMPAGINFAVYGTFFLLASSDFLAMPRTRFLAYLTTGCAGLIAIVLGSLAAQNAVVGIVGTFIVSFSLLICGVLRGFVAAAIPTVLLPFVIAVSAGPALADLPQRLIGYSVAIVFSTFAAMVIWPASPALRLRVALADALASASRLVQAMWPQASKVDGDGFDEAELNARVVDFHRSSRQLRAIYDGNPVRPGGLTHRERALTRMVSEVDRLRMFLRYRAVNRHSASEQDGAVADATASVMQECSHAIVGDGRAPRVSHIEQVRVGSWIDIEKSVADPADSRTTREIIEALESGFGVRIASVYAELLLRDTREVLGDRDEKSPFSFLGLRFAPEHLPAWKMVRAQLTFHSPWFRNAIRGALAMTLAVVLVTLFPIQNGFWVVLGAVTALRSDALGTARTAFGTALGVTAGFVVGIAGLLLIGDRPTLLWILVPILVFLACYTSGAVSLIIGQASFTVFVIMFYAIFLGPKLDTGVIRVSDIVLGVVVSLVASALLWPRGIIANIESLLSIALERAADYLVASYRGLGGTGTTDDEAQVAHRQAAAHDAVARADEAFDLAVVQAGRGVEAAALWSSVLRAATEVVAVGDLVEVINRDGKLRAVPPETIELMAQCATDVTDRMKNQLRSGGDPETLGALEAIDEFPRLATSIESCVNSWRRDPERDMTVVGAAAMQLLIVHEWLEYLKILADQYWGVEPELD